MEMNISLKIKSVSVNFVCLHAEKKGKYLKE